MNRLPTSIRVPAPLRRPWRARAAGRWPYVLPDLAPPPPDFEHPPAPPDFVGVGAQKAGTSWWFGLIVDHPGVHRSPERPKEIHYFDHFWQQELTDRDVEQYHAWFARPTGLLAGEWTPRYLYDWWTPPLVAQAAPGTHILVMLRDPVERYRSGLAFDRARGAKQVALVAQDAFQRGLYGAQLARLLDHFPRDQVLVIQYEKCLADPSGELGRTYRFLGLDPSHRPDKITDHVGPRQAKPAIAGALADRLRDAYRNDLNDLVLLFPELDRTLWHSAIPAS